MSNAREEEWRNDRSSESDKHTGMGGVFAGSFLGLAGLAVLRLPRKGEKSPSSAEARKTFSKS